MTATLRTLIGDTIRQACSALHASPASATMVATALGHVDAEESIPRLLLVEPGSPLWWRIQVVADDQSRAIELIFEVAQDVVIEIQVLEDVAGPVVDEDIVVDGRGRRVTFAQGASWPCRVSASMRRSLDGAWLVRTLDIQRPA